MRYMARVSAAIGGLALIALVLSGDGAGPNAPAPDRATPLKLDMDAIFPQGEGRDLVLTHCIACHGITRMVLTQRTKERWNYVRQQMRPSVPNISDAEADAIFGYLEAHFSDSMPPPKLPDWYLESVPW